MTFLGKVETLKPLPAMRRNDQMGCSFLASDKFVLEDLGPKVRISHPDNVSAAALVPWAAISYALEKGAEEVKPAPSAALGERHDPQEHAVVPVRRVADVVRVDDIPAGLRPPADGSERTPTRITAEQAAGMSESALEAAVNDGAIVEQAPKKRGGWPKGKPRAGKAPADSSGETP